MWELEAVRSGCMYNTLTSCLEFAVSRRWKFCGSTLWIFASFLSIAASQLTDGIRRRRSLRTRALPQLRAIRVETAGTAS